MMRSAAILTLAAAGLVLGASVEARVRSENQAVSAGAAVKQTLTDIKTADELGARFDADRGKFRIVLLLSPT